MRTRYSIILPIAAILSGVFFELNKLSLVGNFLPANVFVKLWPVLLVFVGLDMIFSQHRPIGAITVLFFAAALLSTQFMPEGQNNVIWQFFMKVWPILLILFGLDCILTGRQMINTIIIIILVVILIYVLLNFMNVPAIHSLPINIDLSSIIPTSVFNGTMPIPQNPQPNIIPQFFSQEQPAAKAQDPIIFDNSGNISIPMPDQNNAVLNIVPSSGTISLKAGTEFDQILNGSIQLDQSENFSHNTALTDQVAQYTLKSDGKAQYPQNSNWDLSLTTNRTLAVDLVLASGYVKADLRSLNLSSVNIENKFGPIDVMAPHKTSAKIQITGSGETIRVYVPSDASVTSTISGAASFRYNNQNYSLSGNTLLPRRTYGNPITVEINANGSVVEIIDIP